MRHARLLLLLTVVGCHGPTLSEDAGTTPDGGLTCADTWESYGQGFFTTNCTGCHVHDHANFVSRAVVVGELPLITDKLTTGLMPQGATLQADELHRVLGFLACGAPSGATDAGFDFEADSARVAVAKVKNVLVGLPPTDAEVKAVSDDPAALKGLISGWMALPQYDEKMKVFFELAFQQTQITQADFVDLVPPLGIGTGASTPLLVQNLRESFARTVLALNAEGRPFTEAFTTHRLMLTPALMELYAFLDTRHLDDTGKITDDLVKQFPGVKVTVTGTGGPIPLEQSIDPTSPNFMHWYDPDVGHLPFIDPACNSDPLIANLQSYAVHWLFVGGVPPHTAPSGVNCPQRAGTAAGVHFAPTDFTTWKMVTLRAPTGAEPITRFFDLPTLRSSTELVLKTPRAGFFSTPAFFANWPTNQSNQMRVTVNQALIVATGRSVDGLDPTPSPMTPGIDAAHTAATECFACHRLLDPTRSILSSSWSWFYYPQTDGALVSQKGRFIFQGVDQTVGSLDDFANVLAHHPAVPTAWAQKLCTATNSAPCDLNDPEFQRVVAAFGASGAWSTLVQELLSSPIVTNLAPSRTYASHGEVIAVTRRDHLCAALDARLGLTDVCGLTLLPGVKKPGVGAIPQIVSGMPSDGYGRGSTEPVLPNVPTLFYRAALENVCLQVAAQVIDSQVSPQQPNAKHWTSTQPDAAIADFVTLMVGLAPSDPRSPGVTDLLHTHYTTALTTQSTSDALKSTFVTACLSPTFIGVGM